MQLSLCLERGFDSQSSSWHVGSQGKSVTLTRRSCELPPAACRTGWGRNSLCLSCIPCCVCPWPVPKPLFMAPERLCFLSVWSGYGLSWSNSHLSFMPTKMGPAPLKSWHWEAKWRVTYKVCGFFFKFYFVRTGVHRGWKGCWVSWSWRYRRWEPFVGIWQRSQRSDREVGAVNLSAVSPRCSEIVATVP